MAWWKDLKARLLPVLDGSSPISSLDAMPQQDDTPALENVRDNNIILHQPHIAIVGLCICLSFSLSVPPTMFSKIDASSLAPNLLN